MGLLFWKNNQQIDLFAHAIAEDLFSHIRPQIAHQYIFDKGKLPKKQLRRVDQKFHDIILQTQRHVAATSLGIYGKARLQRAFNERLRELGYETELVKQIAATMLLQNG